jgi:hypothetical protein
MNHPLRTLLRELFVDPILRLLRIRRRERQETVANGSSQPRVTEMPAAPAKPHGLLQRIGGIESVWKDT